MPVPRVRLKRILGALALLFLLTGLAFRLFIWSKLQQVGARTPSVDAAILLQAVRDWRSGHPSTSCPSLVDLRDAALIDLGVLPTDPWENQYVIECEGGSVKVRSLGPDRKANTLDDLVMHQIRFVRQLVLATTLLRGRLFEDSGHGKGWKLSLLARQIGLVFELRPSLLFGLDFARGPARFPVTAFGLDAFNIDDRRAQVLGSYRAIPRHVQGFGELPPVSGLSCEAAASRLRLSLLRFRRTDSRLVSGSQVSGR